MPAVLAVLPEGFEELEAVGPIDCLRRAGSAVTIAALSDSTEVKGRNGITLTADTTLAALGTTRCFDMLFLPGGPGVKLLRADPRVQEVVRVHQKGDAWLAAICAAPTVLADAGLLAGKRFTAHMSVAGELPDLLAHERVVADGRILTSRGAGTAVDFGLFLVHKLHGPDKAAEIAASICA